MSRKRWIPLVIGILLVIGGGVTWAMWPREAPEVKQVQQIANQMFAEETTNEQRQALRDQMRDLRDNLPEEKRQEVFRAMGDQFRQQMTEHIREYATLPEDQRQEFLDRDIDRMEEMRRGFEQRRQRDGERREGGAAGQGRGAGGPDGNRRPRTEEEREQRRRARLDNTTPEDRAHFMAYMQAINARRAERGLEPMRRPGPGRGRPGGPGRGG
ncbi:MAG: hypothetical protein AAGF97_15870 [Planctomycetota bacterium]